MQKFYFLFSVTIISLFACVDEQLPATEAIALNDKAMEVYHYSDSALALLQSAVDIDPNYAVAYQNMIPLQVQKGDFEGALNSNSKIIEMDPTVPDSHCQRGYLLNLSERKTDANSAFKAAKVLYEKHFSAHPNDSLKYAMGYATCLVFLNEHDKANEIIEALKKQSPDNDFVPLYQIPK